jgi:hypothetical protein
MRIFVKLESEKGNGILRANMELEYTKEYINIKDFITEGYSFDFIKFTGENEIIR